MSKELNQELDTHVICEQTLQIPSVANLNPILVIGHMMSTTQIICKYTITLTPGPRHRILFGQNQGQRLECIMNGCVGLYLDSAFQSPILTELNSSNRYIDNGF